MMEVKQVQDVLPDVTLTIRAESHPTGGVWTRADWEGPCDLDTLEGLLARAMAEATILLLKIAETVEGELEAPDPHELLNWLSSSALESAHYVLDRLSSE